MTNLHKNKTKTSEAFRELIALGKNDANVRNYINKLIYTFKFSEHFDAFKKVTASTAREMLEEYVDMLIVKDGTLRCIIGRNDYCDDEDTWEILQLLEVYDKVHITNSVKAALKYAYKSKADVYTVSRIHNDNNEFRTRGGVTGGNAYMQYLCERKRIERQEKLTELAFLRALDTAIPIISHVADAGPKIDEARYWIYDALKSMYEQLSYREYVKPLFSLEVSIKEFEVVPKDGNRCYLTVNAPHSFLVSETDFQRDKYCTVYGDSKRISNTHDTIMYSLITMLARFSTGFSKAFNDSHVQMLIGNCSNVKRLVRDNEKILHKYPALDKYKYLFNTKTVD
jgi:hypothetical protein